MTLLAFAAVRRAEAPLLQSAGACYRSISPARRVLSSKPAARRPVVDRWERQTDGRMDARPFRRPCSAYYAGSVNNYSRLAGAGLCVVVCTCRLTYYSIYSHVAIVL